MKITLQFIPVEDKQSVPGTFSRLDLIDLSKEKVEYLIDLEKLSLTKENLESLKNNQDKFGDLYIKIIKQHFSKFIQNYDNYDLNIIDLVKLLF
jgi:hypothetical protein